MAEIFVFGSNLAGRHGKGAAFAARTKWGAKYGVGVGPTGRAYAIPTKDRNLNTLPLPMIRQFVGDFLAYARAHPEHTFKLSAIGCGLAGYTPKDIAPLFASAPDNIVKPVEFGGTYHAETDSIAGPDGLDESRQRPATDVRTDHA